MADKTIDVKLCGGKGTFTDSEGVSQEYDVFSIILKDMPLIPIRIKPADATSKAILKSALGIE